jgi:hypothetical protein
MIGAKDVDDLIERAECARTAFERYPFLRSVEDWREGALLVLKQGTWTSASPCEKFAYYDFAVRRKKDVTSCTYTSDKNDTTSGVVIIPKAYLAMCSAWDGVTNGTVSIKMSSDGKGAVFCNGEEMRSTSMVPDDHATVMHLIRAKFIIGLLSGEDINEKKKVMLEELGAKSLFQDRSHSQRSHSQKTECERRVKASIAIWPDLEGKLACSYTEASRDLKEEAGKLKKAQLEAEFNNLLLQTSPMTYYKKEGERVFAAASSLASSGAGALGSGLYAGASALGLVPRS